MKWYKYDIQELTNNEYTKWYSMMSKEKQQRVDRFRFADDKKRTVAGEMLSRKVISEWFDIAPESILFDKKKHGKPFAKGLPIEFNVGHSCDIVVCAINDKPVGIDIEQIRPIDLNVAKRVFSDEELLYLFNHKPAQCDFVLTDDVELLTRFFEIWTTKEADVKCKGTGVADISLPVTSKVEVFSFDDYIVSVAVED